jgi:hypothetical protein
LEYDKNGVRIFLNQDKRYTFFSHYSRLKLFSSSKLNSNDKHVGSCTIFWVLFSRLRSFFCFENKIIILIDDWSGINGFGCIIWSVLNNPYSVLLLRIRLLNRGLLATSRNGLYGLVLWWCCYQCLDV